ncbi:MAG: restriction endonuclease subunit S [Nitrococcus sp.]|nr:restriction endonuclease subunit S [Nitrococcus sp.]
MTNGWRDTTIGDEVTLQRGFDITRAQQRPGSVPVVSSGGISSVHDTAMVEGPGVVLGRKGVVGSVYYIDTNFWPHDTTLWVKDFKDNFPRFVYYFFREMAGQITGMDVGSANPTLNRNHVHPIEVRWPSLPQQRAIAGVLGALDDKIEQNRRTAQALERLARAIFRAWFAGFEPVKAKAAGATAFPSVPQHVFDALPTTLADSDIGPVPEGWEVKAIGDVVTVKGGGTPSTKNAEYWDGGEHCWATPKDMSRLSHPVLLDTERHITDTGVSGISSGMLPAGTVLMSSRAPVGYLAIAGVATAINQGFIAMVCDGPLPPIYVLNWAAISIETIKAHASGTTFAEISKKNFRPLPVILPTADVIAAYQHVADPLFELLTACVKESEQLAAMRDYLLPKLLSGEVRVEGAHG